MDTEVVTNNEESNPKQMDLSSSPDSTQIHSDSKGFRVSSNDTGFTQRQKDIFGQLTTLEAQHQKVHVSSSIELERSDSDDEEFAPSPPKKRHVRKSVISVPKSLLGTNTDIESITFKKPRKPGLNKQVVKLPDHLKNPHRWQKYDLRDTPEMSNSSNASAAFTFMKEIDDKKPDNQEDEILDLSPNSRSKIIFHKPSFPRSLAPLKKKVIAKATSSESDPGSSVTKLQESDEVTSSVNEGDLEQDTALHLVVEKKSEIKLDHLFDSDSSEDE